MKALKRLAHWLDIYLHGNPIEGEIVEIKKDIMQRESRLWASYTTGTGMGGYCDVVSREIHASLRQETGNVVDVILERTAYVVESPSSPEEWKKAEMELQELHVVPGMKISSRSHDLKPPYRIRI